MELKPFEALYSPTRPAAINPALLLEQAAAVFGERLCNIDAGDSRGLGVHLYGVEAGDAERWEAILRAHDGTRQTDQQIAEAGRQAERQALITKLRTLPDDDVVRMLARQIGIMD